MSDSETKIESNSLKISSIVIAKNEETNIEQCLKSQLGCIDDIVVVVDESSEDRTLEIAQSIEGVNCYIAEWKGYAKTKQDALLKTKYDWIFWIDADERITTELRDELVKFKKMIPKYSIFNVPRKAYFLNKWIKHSGWYPGRVERLFNKQNVSFSDNDVHEHLVNNGEIGILKNDLEHFTDPSIAHYFNKFNKYTSLAANELSQRNKKASIWDLLIRPTAIFLKMYIFNRGILDGFHGLILALFSSLYVFVKYSKLWELNLKNNKVK